MANPSNYIQKLFVGAGSASGPGIAFLDDSQSGLFYKSAGVVGLAISGSEILNFSSTGMSGAQTIAGIQTFSSLPVFSAGISTPRANVASAAAINSLSSASGFVKLTGSTATTINGVAAGVTGQRLVIANLTGQNMTISNASASGASGEKITTMTGSDVVTTGNGSVELIYDTDASPAVWLVISQNL